MTIIAHQPVLVLNKLWTPVGVSNVRRCMRLLSCEYADGEPKAMAVRKENGTYVQYSWSDWSDLKPLEDDPNVIRTLTRKYLIPNIIRVTRCDKMPHQRVRFNRKTLFRRDNYRCQYCGAKPGTEELTLDHVVPRAQGGQTTWENIVCSCVECNRKKGARTPEQCGWTLKIKPTKPRIDILGRERCKIPECWADFISTAYWNTDLVNDMND